MRQEMLTVHPRHQQIEPSFETMAPTQHAISQNLSFVQHRGVRAPLKGRVLAAKSHRAKERSKARNSGVSLMEWKVLSLIRTSVRLLKATCHRIATAVDSLHECNVACNHPAASIRGHGVA
jgi:hypothetical protein